MEQKKRGRPKLHAEIIEKCKSPTKGQEILSLGGAIFSGKWRLICGPIILFQHSSFSIRRQCSGTV